MSDDLLELAVMAGQMSGGATPDMVRARSNGASDESMRVAARLAGIPSMKIPKWTEDENAFLREQTGWLSIEEIAEHLGRTPTAVMVHRKRKGIVGPTGKHNPYGWMTARSVARVLGIGCSKTVVRMIHEGILPGRLFPVDRIVYCISEHDLKRWLIRPENWVYFDIDNIQDPRLYRLVQLKKARWGDEWWSTSDVARYHGCDSNDVVRQIKLGRLRAVQPNAPGTSWHIRRSDAVNIQIPRGRGSRPERWSDDGNAFLILAKAIGFSSVTIMKMGWSEGTSPWYPLRTLQKTDVITPLIERHGLDISHDPETGRLWADWRKYTGRFPVLRTSIDRFLHGPANNEDLRIVRHILISWLRWYGDADDEEQRAMIRSLRASNKPNVWAIRSSYRTVKKWLGIDPFHKE